MLILLPLAGAKTLKTGTFLFLSPFEITFIFEITSTFNYRTNINHFRPTWEHILCQLKVIDAKLFEDKYGKPFFQELKAKLEANKAKELIRKKKQEEIERKAKERFIRLQQLNEDREQRTKSFMAKPYFVNLIPKEITPTLNFYLGMRIVASTFLS